MKGMNPMFAHVTPAQLRQMSGTMGGMSDNQLNAAKQAAAGQFGAGGQAPGAAAAAPAENLPAAAQRELTEAKAIKDKAAADFKAQNYEAASEKYYQVLNTVRMNTDLKASRSGKELETQARLNIALCKLNQKVYDVAIDQCERVLESEPRNSKACFRLASAMYQASEKCTKPGTEKDIRAVYNYA